MPLIQSPVPARKLQEGLRLTELPDGVLAPELVGVILVEDFSAPLSDIERGCMGTEVVTAAAGQLPIVALVGVGDPRPYDLVVTEFHFSCATQTFIQLVRPSVELTGLQVSGETSFVDFNLPGRPTSQLNTNSVAALPAGFNLWQGDAEIDVIYRVPLEIRLGQPPIDNSLVIGGNAVAGQIRGGFKWTESPPQG